MTFKEWFELSEAGHMTLNSPRTIIVMLHGRPTPIKDVAMIDPRLELYNIPVPADSPSKSKKFLGDSAFSLPLVGSDGKVYSWLVSDQRIAIFSGTAHWSTKPVGVELPINWADNAHIMGRDGHDLASAMPTHGVAVKIA